MYHAIYGFVVMRDAKYNVGSYPFSRNWFFFFQRWTGVYLFIFITYHVTTMRFVGIESSFDKVATTLANPWMMTFYILGVLTAAWHLANGLWLFGINWGILIGPRAQRIAQDVLTIFFVALSAVGVSALFAFV